MTYSLVEIFRIRLLYPATLVNLCQVSHRFPTLCKSLLYERVNIDFHDDAEMRLRVSNSDREYDPKSSNAPAARLPPY